VQSLHAVFETHRLHGPGSPHFVHSHKYSSGDTLYTSGLSGVDLAIWGSGMSNFEGGLGNLAMGMLLS
jgi:hypothetical protein